MNDSPADNPTLLLKNVEVLGKRFCTKHLGGLDIPRLESDWFYALSFLFERTFMRGRRDEVSFAFLSFARDRLQKMLRLSEGLDAAYLTLKEHHAFGHLDSGSIGKFKKRHGMKGTANAITHQAFEDEIAANNPIVKGLTTNCDGMVNSKSTPLSNEKDLMMVLDTLALLCEPGRQNVYVYLLDQIKTGRTETAYKTLDGLIAVGDKLASMTIRDICMQRELVPEDFGYVFPVDTWVRQMAPMLGCRATTDAGIKAFFRNQCTDCGVDIMLFAAGMWYLGTNAQTILVEDFLGKYEIWPRH